MADSSNPYSTKFVRPGAMRFVADEAVVSAVFEQWRKSQFRGQIVGPHGSGKTTLLWEILRRCYEPEIGFQFFQIQAGQKRTELDLKERLAEHHVELNERFHLGPSIKHVLVVDGIDSASVWQRMSWKRATAGRAVLVTTHRHIGLETVYHSTPEFNQFWKVVRAIHPDETMSKKEVRFIFEQHRGDFRGGFV